MGVIHDLTQKTPLPDMIPIRQTFPREKLEELGVTEATTGCPLRSSMAVKCIGRTVEGHPVYLDEFAAGADGIVAVNRIKPHTSYNGAYGQVIFDNAPVLFGVGILENPNDETCRLAPLLNREIPIQEPMLQEEARKLMPRIYFE